MSNVSISVTVYAEEFKNRFFYFDLSGDICMKLNEFIEYILNKKKELKEGEYITIICNWQNGQGVSNYKIPYEIDEDNLSDTIYHLSKEILNRKNIHDSINYNMENTNNMPYTNAYQMYNPCVSIGSLQYRPYGFGFASPMNMVMPSPIQRSPYIQQPTCESSENKNVDTTLRGELLNEIGKLIDKYVEDMKDIDNLFKEEEE